MQPLLCTTDMKYTVIDSLLILILHIVHSISIVICWQPFYHLLKLFIQFSHLGPREVWLPGGRQDPPPKLTSLSSVVSTTEEDEEGVAQSNLDIEVGGVKLVGVNVQAQWGKCKMETVYSFRPHLQHCC